MSGWMGFGIFVIVSIMDESEAQIASATQKKALVE